MSQLVAGVLQPTGAKVPVQLDLDGPPPLSDALRCQVGVVESDGRQRSCCVVDFGAGIRDERIDVCRPHQARQLRAHQRGERQVPVRGFRPGYLGIQVGAPIHLDRVDRFE